MGVSIAWIAVKGLPADAVLARLALVPAGRPCHYPFKGVGSHALDGGWRLVMAGRCNHRIVRAASMAALSAGCRAVACAVEEHVNFASAELWQDGVRLWQVIHQGDMDSQHMATEGSPPARFQALLATVEPEDSTRLEGHWHMDIPLILAQEMTGFRHDESNEAFDRDPFEELVDSKPVRKWWKPWA